MHLLMGRVLAAEKVLRNRGRNMSKGRKVGINARILPGPRVAMNKYTKLLHTQNFTYIHLYIKHVFIVYIKFC